MRIEKPNLRAVAKEQSRERIVDAAGRTIRENGYAGTGVADVMNEAGLTHGAFYAHFASREEMLLAAAEHACTEARASTEKLAESVAPEEALNAVLRAYFSQSHLEHVDVGCPMAALASETPRQTAQVRKAVTLHLKKMIDLIARYSPDWGESGAHERALVTVATMVGTLQLARVVDDPALSKSLRKAALAQLTRPPS